MRIHVPRSFASPRMTVGIYAAHLRDRTQPRPFKESVDERDVRSHGLAVQVKTDRALLVGAVGFYTGLL